MKSEHHLIRILDLDDYNTLQPRLGSTRDLGLTVNAYHMPDYFSRSPIDDDRIRTRMSLGSKTGIHDHPFPY